MYVSVGVCARECQCHGISPELELQAVVSHSIWLILLEEQYALLSHEPFHLSGIILILNQVLRTLYFYLRTAFIVPIRFGMLCLHFHSCLEISFPCVFVCVLYACPFMQVLHVYMGRTQDDVMNHCRLLLYLIHWGRVSLANRVHQYD